VVGGLGFLERFGVGTGGSGGANKAKVHGHAAIPLGAGRPRGVGDRGPGLRSGGRLRPRQRAFGERLHYHAGYHNVEAVFHSRPTSPPLPESTS
jgi:hypothetical protein